MKSTQKNVTMSAILLSIYVAAVWFAYIYLNIKDNKTSALFITLVIAMASYFVFSIVMRKLSAISLVTVNNWSKKRNATAFFVSALVTFIVMMLWYIAYYPGSFSVDSFYQYSQALNGSYSDWHPVWHTLLFFTLPLRLTGKASSIVLFQIIYFSLILGYLGMAVSSRIGVRAAVLSLAYILLNPYTGCIELYPWKDVAFAMAALLCTVITFEVYYSDGECFWSRSKIGLLLWGIIITSTTIFRHNAILFTAPLLAALFFNMKKKAWVYLMLATVISFIVIKGPIYSILNVGDGGSRAVDCSGLPLTVIGNVVKETPQLMDEDLSEFVYSIASQEDWENNYTCGHFYKMSWYDYTAVEEKGVTGMFGMMFKAFRLSPNASLKAFFSVTDMVYGFETDLYGIYGSGTSENSYGIESGGNAWLSDLLNAYYATNTNSFLRYFSTYGIAILAMLFAILTKMQWKSYSSWKKAFLAIPVFAYDFGTMMLLQGPDSRFFYVTFLVCPVVIILALYQKGVTNE